MIIIGDVHGRVNEYKKLLTKIKQNSIQLGDFGFKKEHEWFLRHMNTNKHKICFGNHDDYTYLHHPHSLGNYTFLSDLNLMSVRGAFSIDRKYRLENISWWANEEMNMIEMQEAIDYYTEIKPQIVVSHDAPHSVRFTFFGIYDKTLTSNGLQVMFENHQPDLWIFGHHHYHCDKMINGTRFVCLDELESFVI